MITAKIIVDSISVDNIRLTTFELEYPRYIHSQVMTHRQFSRNAQSSRAIPTSTLINRIIENPNGPKKWEKNQPGMQSDSEITTKQSKKADRLWGDLTAYSIDTAAKLVHDCQVHKQWANRILEPFSTIKVIITATEFDNFFNLRLTDEAQPEIAELARKMDEALDNSKPRLLAASQWHLPYVQSIGGQHLGTLKKLSVARCARVSYLNHDKTEPDVEADLKLYDILYKNRHMSPFEHQASPMRNARPSNYIRFDTGTTHIDKDKNYWSGNFRGWIQHRQII